MDESTSGSGVVPGGGPGAGYVRKGWIMGLGLGLFFVTLSLLWLLQQQWPSCIPEMAALKPVAVTSASQGASSQEASATSAAPPKITSVFPRSGNTAGGERVKISGTGFTDKTSVKFDETPAAATDYVASTTLLATVPAHGEGVVDISVQNDPSTVSVLPGGFAYRACPGETAILLLVLIAGALGGALHSVRSFYWYVGNRDLKWSWVPTYAFRPITGAALACIFFLCISGGIVNSQNPSNRLWIVGLAALIGLFSQQGFEKLKKIFEAIFTPVPPAADKPKQTGAAPAIDPPSGPQAGGNVVKITGTGFLAGTTVQFGTVQSPSVKVDSPTTLSVTVPAAQAAGAVDVTVEILGGAKVTLPGAYTYKDEPKQTGAAPPIATIDPPSGPQTGGNVVKITGTGFLAGTTVQFGTVQSSSVQIDSPTTLSVTVPAAQAAGAVDVIVEIPGGAKVTLPGGYTYK